MENSIILPEISEIKKFISEAYEDSKKKMNLRTKTLLTIGLTLFLLLLVVICSLFINSTDITTNFSIMNSPPSFEHLFGTDWMGRNMFTRTLKGLGLSVQIGAGASILSSLIAIGMAFLGSLNKYLEFIR